MSEQNPIMERITEGVELGRGGDPEGARAILAEGWDQLRPGGDPLHVVSLAHYMADLQDDTGDELEWDLRALAAADALGKPGLPSGVNGPADWCGEPRRFRRRMKADRRPVELPRLASWQ